MHSCTLILKNKTLALKNKKEHNDHLLTTLLTIVLPRGEQKKPKNQNRAEKPKNQIEKNRNRQKPEKTVTELN